MTSAFSWVDIAVLVVAVAALAVTVAIFLLGRRLSFHQQRERVRELDAKAGDVLAQIRTRNLNSKIIVMNVARYRHGYDGSNNLTWRGHAFTGPEIIEMGHGGVEVITRGVESYFDADTRRTLAQTANPAPNVIECGHIPWKWIEYVDLAGDEFDGSPIFFVRHRAPGRQPYDYMTYREGKSVPFGPNNRDYYVPVLELGTRRPQFVSDWWCFFKSLRQDKKVNAEMRWRDAP